jgi:hypothetical protein
MVLELPFWYGWQLLCRAVQERERERAWDAWVAQLPFMDKDSFVPFEDYWKPPAKRRKPRKTDAELLAKAGIKKATC